MTAPALPQDPRLSQPALREPSATGVEARLRVAGAGARAHAFMVDFYIRVALAFAWYAAGAVLHSMLSGGEATLRPPREPDAWWNSAVVVPVVVIYLLYHPVVETLLRGLTPGKRFAGLRISTLDGGVPSTGALLLRNVFRIIDSAPVFYGVGLLMSLVNRRGQRLGDLAAGTLLVYDDGKSDAALRRRSGVAAVDALLDEHRAVARRLARARIEAPMHRDTEALEARHAALHLALRHDPPTLRQWVDRVFEETLPRASRELRPFLGATLLGFALAALAGYGLVTVEPDSIRLFASPQMIEQVGDGRLWTQGLLGVAPASVISGVVFANNLLVALIAWLLGFLFALGTIYVIGVNGVMVGALFALSASHGLGGAFLDFAIAHGPAEIFCLCAAGAAGAVVGEALARPGGQTRAEAFSAAVRR
ncbi:MAG: hypothetical protein EBS39_06425, partial [Gammaproteobacteria bacterium]|nr:hypothetical protein [Gammaproteobacteria bacterium]